jgi:hypothetical protein
MFLILLLALGTAFVASVVSVLRRPRHRIENDKVYLQIVLWIDGSLASTTFAHNLVTAFRDNSFEKIQVVQYDDKASGFSEANQTLHVYLVPEADVPPSEIAFAQRDAGFIIISLSDVPENATVLRWRTVLTNLSMKEVCPPISMTNLANPRLFRALCQKITRIISPRVHGFDLSAIKTTPI